MRQWLHDLRINENFSHNDVAKDVGITRAYYGMIENGERTPSVSIAKKIGKKLNFDWTDFFTKKSN